MSDTPVPHRLTLTIEGQGEVVVFPPLFGGTCSTTCSDTGTGSVNLTTGDQPVPGWLFDHWSGDCTGTDNECTVSLSADRSVTAHYIKMPVLTLTVSGAGKVAANGGFATDCVGTATQATTCKASFPTGSRISLLATPAPGSRLDGWTGPCEAGVPDPNACFFDLSGDTNVSAAFKANCTTPVIGAASAVQDTVTILRGSGEVSVASGAAICLYDQVLTDAGGGLQITLLDDTLFTIGPNSDMIVDEFVYDPNGNSSLGKIAARIVKGVFRFITGKIGQKNPDDVKITTPVVAIGIRGTDFTTQVNRSGNVITNSVAVTSGSVALIDLHGNVTATLTAGQTGQASAEAPTLFASILPASRSVVANQTATAFASIFNAGPANALSCTIAAPQQPPNTFFFQTTDAATNAPTGTPNVPVNIPPGGTQSFFFAIKPTSTFNAMDLQLAFKCNSVDAVAPLVGVNTLLLSSSAGPVPDVITVGVTPSNDGIVHIPGTGPGLFAIATTNIGAAGQVTARLRLSDTTMPVSATLCETVAGTGACKAPPAANVTRAMATNEVTTWSAFLTGAGTVPLDPAKYRAFFEFVDSVGAVRGSTSVAVRTQ